jgi:hypothetical protein
MNIRARFNAIVNTWVDLSSRIPILIAMTATLGALMAWGAALAETETTEYHLRAVQDYMAQTMEQQVLQWRAEQDQRLFARFQEHVKAWRLLRGQADAVPAGAAALRASLEMQTPVDLAAQRRSLEMQAQVELAAARSMLPFFKNTPSFGDEQGIDYKPDEWVRNQRLQDPALRRLHPETTETRAGTVHTRALSLLGLVVLFSTSLLFLTVAELTDSPASRLWANMGAAVIAAGIVAASLAMVRLR